MFKNISGFSKKSKEEKIDWLIRTHFKGNQEARKLLVSYINSDKKLQELHDDFIENALSNFYLPLSVAPNFLINQKEYTLPMVIEESSVVAAASKSAKYWKERGGFKTTIIGQEKVGQIHFIYKGSTQKLISFFDKVKPILYKDSTDLTKNMTARGGGILSIDLIDKTSKMDNYYQVHVCFNTIDSMGANFINSCLEQFARTLVKEVNKSLDLEDNSIEIVMSILSNYVPNCLVKAEVRCLIEELEPEEGMSKRQFAEKFIRAVKIAKIDPHRAVTHNKGIMNGVDAVVLATGNDFRAIEAGIHAYASRTGQYQGLSRAYIEQDDFCFELEIPLAVGTIGGLTSLHPLVKWSLALLDNPSASELMSIISTAGLAQNFAAIRSLITSGIQKGHMKLHLLNILNLLKASQSQKLKAIEHFKTNPVSFNIVAKFLKNS